MCTHGLAACHPNGLSNWTQCSWKLSGFPKVSHRYLFAPQPAIYIKCKQPISYFYQSPNHFSQSQLLQRACRFPPVTLLFANGFINHTQVQRELPNGNTHICLSDTAAHKFYFCFVTACCAHPPRMFNGGIICSCQSNKLLLLFFCSL